MSADCFLQTCLQLTDHFLAQSPPKISDYVNMGLYKSSPQGQSRTVAKLEMLQQKCLKHMNVSLCSWWKLKSTVIILRIPNVFRSLLFYRKIVTRLLKIQQFPKASLQNFPFCSCPFARHLCCFLFPVLAVAGGANPVVFTLHEQDCAEVMRHTDLLGNGQRQRTSGRSEDSVTWSHLPAPGSLQGQLCWAPPALGTRMSGHLTSLGSPCVGYLQSNHKGNHPWGT